MQNSFVRAVPLGCCATATRELGVFVLQGTPHTRGIMAAANLTVRPSVTAVGLYFRKSFGNFMSAAVNMVKLSHLSS